MASEFQDLVIVIINDDVFYEFYEHNSNSISSALHIKSRKIAQDMSRWFDGFDKYNPHNPKVDFIRFKKEILRNYDKIKKQRRN